MICQNLGGDIEVDSDGSSWTKFKFWVKVEISDQSIPIVSNLDAQSQIEQIISNPAVRNEVQQSVVLSKEEIQMNDLKLLFKNKKIKIVCADDIYYSLEALRVVFTNMGLIEYCTFVNNGRQLVDYFTEQMDFVGAPRDEINIVIADYEMPVLTGLDAVKEIRAIFTVINQRLLKKHQIKNGKRLVGDKSDKDFKKLTMPTFILSSTHSHKGFR
jgi:CheY-like chemotaxis protein